MRVFTEAYKQGIELHIYIGRTDISVIEDKIMAFCQAHNPGPTGMDIGIADSKADARGTREGESSPGCSTRCRETSYGYDTPGPGRVTQYGYEMPAHDDEGSPDLKGFQVKEKGNTPISVCI